MKEKQLDGEALVSFPSDYSKIVRKMILHKRFEYKTLDGWFGPRQFEDLPVHQLPTNHPDPKIEEGLKAIHDLDNVLHDKTIDAILIEQEVFPDVWATKERRRLELETEALRKTLKYACVA